MNNIEKKLDALIDALGFDVKEFHLIGEKYEGIGKPISSKFEFVNNGSATGYYIIDINYKLTKRVAELPLDCVVLCVLLPIQSEAWGSIVEYCSNHGSDIEIGIDDFDTLRPIWDFMTRGGIEKD